jgi:hypothetical protein
MMARRAQLTGIPASAAAVEDELVARGAGEGAAGRASGGECA